MGEIAEDLINGACCQWCNQYFVQDHGYPVLCKSCWEDDMKDKDEDEKDNGYPKAIHDEF